MFDAPCSRVAERLLPTAKRVTSNWFGLAAMIVLIVLGLALAGSIILQSASDRIIANHAERTAQAWAEYVGSQLGSVEAVADGAPLSAEQREFLQSVTRFGPVFRFKLFDNLGRLIIVSDDLAGDGPAAERSNDHNQNARSVLATGTPVTGVKSGVGNPNRPDIYAESYVPVMNAGRVVAISEVYVDQTQQAAETRSDFILFGLKIAGMTLLALAIPFAALITLARRIRRQNEVLRAEKERVQAAERAKAEFLANMSHELRTPLNAINGFSELLAEEAYGPLGNGEYKKFAKAINDSGQLLLELINDVLDISKIEAGNAELKEETFPIMPVIDACITMVRERATEGGVELVVDTATGTLPQLHADKMRIKQVVLNLLSNAVKFTPSGGRVTLKVWCGNDSGFVFQVADTGIGISADNIPKALARFQQVDGGLNRKHEGSGLGLPLAKSLVEMHDGSLDLQSELGVGTTVTVRLPAARAIRQAA